MTIRIDEKRIFEAIEHRKPRSVALNGPEALIPKLQDVADHIAEMFDVQVYIIGDTCWGSCDLNTHADMLAEHSVQYWPYHCNGYLWPEGHDDRCV